jgi:hypothetical protein
LFGDLFLRRNPHGSPVVRNPGGTGTTPAITRYHGRSRFSEVHFRGKGECVNHP